MKKNFSITMIFEGSALNRGEKIGGNVVSIKKLYLMNDIYPFISRQAMRHYLFATLNKNFPERWRATEVTNQGQVIQFDLTKENILTSAELDAFGYMFTISSSGSLTRKSRVGITKAISLFPYKGDMAMYANHDLVQRALADGIEATPNPYNAEEALSLFKVSFTIDGELLGKDEWKIEKYEHDDAKKQLKIFLTTPKSKKSKSENKEESNESSKQENLIYSEIQFDQKLADLNGESYVTKNGKVCLTQDSKIIRCVFEVEENEKCRRLIDLLQAIKGGLYAHSSGEDNTIIPLFLIIAPVKVPSPIFHPYLHMAVERQSVRLIGLEDCFENPWLEDKESVYVWVSERFKQFLRENLPNINIASDDKWSGFLKKWGLVCQS